MHLADIDHHGIYVDFGTPARFKYTLGNWRSGWGADVVEQGVAFTWATVSPARAYFHLDQAGPLRLMFRARRGDNSRISVYVNDEPITRITLPEGWSEHQVEVAADKARAGENSLKLVHSGTEGTEHSFALDYLRIVPGGGAAVVGERFLAPTSESVSRAVTVGSEERPAIALRAPTRMSTYLELPRDARLGFGVALVEGVQATARVSITDADSGRTVRLHNVDLARTDTPGWRDALIDLSAQGGKIVRLDLAVESTADSAEIAWSTPSILTRRSRVEAGEEPQIRNVIVLLVDTQRADALTTYSPSRVQSPQFDRFSREAAVFDQCQSPANWTKPACASVLTGLHPLTHRALTETAAMSSSARLCSELFQHASFQTAALIANGYLAGEFGFNQGWHLYRNYIRERLPTEAERVFTDALAWIEQNRSQRLFMYVHTIDPHVPYDPPSEDLQLYDPAPYEGPVNPRSTGNLLEEFKREQVQLSSRDRERLRALYDGEVTYHDRHFGRFIDRLRELQLLDSTMIVVTADHGEEFFEHESVGHGHSLFQELLHVPLAIRTPGRLQGRRIPQPCSLVDIVPTVLEATGIERPADLEGRSLLPDLRGRPGPVVAASFSSAWDTGNSRETAWSVRMGEWKLRMHGPANSYLYNLARDPREQQDFDTENPIALRATRIAMGQFLGAPAKGDWTAAALAETSIARPQPQAEEAQMTPELCAQLRALGYMVNCE